MERTKTVFCRSTPPRGKWLLTLGLMCGLLGHAGMVLAWGVTGHEVVAKIAEDRLTPVAREKIHYLLSQDTDTLTEHDFVSISVWADRFREVRTDGRRDNYQHTHLWHFADLDRNHPDLPHACFGHLPLPSGVPASAGPNDSCVVDKVAQFTHELSSFHINPAMSAQDRQEAILALKYLVHFMGDLHQPLHAIDDHDRGGNEVKVAAQGMKKGSLHHVWDENLVELLGPRVDVIAARLEHKITSEEARQWQQGTPNLWIRESWELARSTAYDPLPPPDGRGVRHLSADYVDHATATVALQLEKAGVRLAWLLNQALGRD